MKPSISGFTSLQPGPHHPEFPVAVIDLWYIALNKSDANTDSLQLLNREESERAKRFVFEKDRNSYVRARSAMRTILARYLCTDAKTIGFDYNAYGKPDICTTNSSNRLFFNISHSADIALLAITGVGQVGVDIEYIKPDLATLSLAQNTFSRAEVTALEMIPSNLFATAFYRCWTRKEAFVKALGDGLSFPLKDFDVSIGTGGSNRLLELRAKNINTSDWQLYGLEQPGDIRLLKLKEYIAAVTVQSGNNLTLNYFVF